MVPGPQPTSSRSIPGRSEPEEVGGGVGRRSARCGCAAPTRGDRGCRCRARPHDDSPLSVIDNETLFAILFQAWRRSGCTWWAPTATPPVPARSARTGLQPPPRHRIRAAVRSSGRPVGAARSGTWAPTTGSSQRVRIVDAALRCIARQGTLQDHRRRPGPRGRGVAGHPLPDLLRRQGRRVRGRGRDRGGPLLLGVGRGDGRGPRPGGRARGRHGRRRPPAVRPRRARATWSSTSPRSSCRTWPSTGWTSFCGRPATSSPPSSAGGSIPTRPVGPPSGRPGSSCRTWPTRRRGRTSPTPTTPATSSTPS